jgi:predicted TIM-barrel fold metal-dependent hydrolase
VENADLARPVGPEDYRAAAAGLDIEATVWIEAVAADPLAEAREAAAINAGDSRIASALVAQAPLDAPDIGDRLDRLRAALPGLKGIRDIVAERPGHVSFARQSGLLTRPAFAEGLMALAERDLVFDLMLEPWQMPMALDLIRRIPALTFVIEHSGSPDFASEEGTELWFRAMRQAAGLPNIVVKISALHCRMPGWTDLRLAPPIHALIEWFGAGRLAFASDFPVHDRTVPLRRAFETFAGSVADLSITEQAALFRDTARRIYRI